MSLALATITAGAVRGSQQVTVACAAPNGTSLVIYRNGTWLIGQGTITAGVALIAVSQLATGDILQASVTERGNQSGPPVQVTDTTDLHTGWRIPQSVQIQADDGTISTITAAEYETRYGTKPAAVYDPSLRISIVAPDADAVSTAAAVQPILFDVRIEQSSGATTVTIQNVINQTGGAIVRWASTEGFGNALSRSFTQNATVTVDVKGENDAASAYVTRTFSVTVFNPSAATPSASDIIALGYSRTAGTDILWGRINSYKACECRLEGYDNTWKAAEFHEFDYQECPYYPVPAGTYKLWARLAGDINPDRWKSVPIVKP